MTQSKLDQLKTMTTVVADTGDIDSIARLKPEDATTNPTLVLKAIESGKYEAVIEKALLLAGDGSNPLTAGKIADALAVSLGVEILQHVPGLVSTEVDARLSFDTEKTISKAHDLIALYAKAGIGKDRILIKIASTWEGIQAAKVLEKEGIHCNLTLLFAFEQALACARANATLISPFVGRILDWYKAAKPEADFNGMKDPGVVSVTEIYHYFKLHGVSTVVMGASFRTAEEIECLSGCDKLTISPALIDTLSQDNGTLVRQLSPTNAPVLPLDKQSEAEFRLGMNANAMATEKLAHGIRGFIQDQVALEALLTKRFL